MFRSQSSDHHQGLITVLVQLLLIGVHASSYSGMWLYVVCSSVHTMYLSAWCLVMYWPFLTFTCYVVYALLCMGYGDCFAEGKSKVARNSPPCGAKG